MKHNFSERIQNTLKLSKTQLKHIPKNCEDYFTCSEKNCENIIGAVSIPMGIAGPILLKGEHAKGKYVLPLATSEGCLVASINRGCKAITQSGGTNTSVKKIGITRAPVFRVKNLEESRKFETWIKENFELLSKETETTSQYLELIKTESRAVGKQVFIKFFFDAKDAMGMNMAVIACDHLVRKVITPQTGIECIALSGNFCTDKKPAAVNFIQGRGFMVNAEIEIPENIVKEVLKTSPQDILDVYMSKIVIGSSLAYSLGYNAHFANVIAALFAATGQDLAHTVEGAAGITSVEVTDSNNLYMSVHLPSIVCGITGGGTSLPKQKESLEIMGLKVDSKNPGKKNLEFAEIIAGAVLAGELSLLAALASQDLAKAHSQLRIKK